MVEIPPYFTDDGVNNVTYLIQEYTPQPLSDDRKHARLLLQGTFGPTLDSLQEARDLVTATQWVQDQFNKPLTSHREHYRRRTNGYMKNDLSSHVTRRPCDTGSRWNRHAFNRWRDIGKTIHEVPTGTGSYYLKVDGIARTEVSVPPSVEFNLPNASYVICRGGSNNMKMSDFFFHEPTGQRGTLLVASDSSMCTMPVPSEYL
jgi:cullin-associated NEDD8-dissociated protein 1